MKRSGEKVYAFFSNPDNGPLCCQVIQYREKQFGKGGILSLLSKISLNDGRDNENVYKSVPRQISTIAFFKHRSKNCRDLYFPNQEEEETKEERKGKILLL